MTTLVDKYTDLGGWGTLKTTTTETQDKWILLNNLIITYQDGQVTTLKSNRNPVTSHVNYEKYVDP